MDVVIVYSENVHTSVANAKRFFSPPDMPFKLPGIPMVVFWHFVKPIWNKHKIERDEILVII